MSKKSVGERLQARRDVVELEIPTPKNGVFPSKFASEDASKAGADAQDELYNFTGRAQVQVKRDRINHKVEQVIRAIYLGLESQNVDCTKGTSLENFKAGEWVVIGIADHRGYRFTPDTNTRLIMMGYNPVSVLASLTRMRLNGAPVVAVQGGTLIAMHGAVAQNSRDQVFNTKALLDLHREIGKPKLFA